ncbi:MAG: acyltransferase domain-containing protein [Acidimicrobiales bacterium]
MEQAWRASGLDPASVGLIEAHGTATPVGDRIELETLRTVFGGPEAGRPRAGLGSVKSMIGHAMPAAGAAGLAKAALAVFHGELPPTLHVDEPNAAVDETRFRLITEVEPWEGDEPRIAGVNAFGFGGINAHVVLSEPPGLRSGRRRSSGPAAVDAVDAVHGSDPIDPDAEEVLLLAGEDAADLLAQLDSWAPSGGARLRVPTGGPARLAIVAPDDRRLTLARKVLERGTPFRGRNDVWFDPTGLVADGGKVAFLFPGVEPVFEPRVDDVAERFGLAWEGLDAEAAPLQAQGRGIVAVGRLLAAALGRLGVTADAMAGHSLGEWTGQVASGMIPASYVEEFLGSLQPGSIEVSDVVFVALGCGADVAAELVAGLPDAHVSHDNCPHQSVICMPASLVDEAMARAKDRKVLAQELPFRSGFHSPLFAPYVAAMAEQFGAIPLVPAAVPMWSATSVAPYPDDPAAITELSGRHLVEPVRFRELAEALYADGVRVFVQVGTGSLMGFVDDTLRDHDVLGISANVARQSGIAQLRRVAAALWSVGVAVDFAPLGHAVAGPEPGEASTRRGGTPVPVALGSPLVRGLHELRGLAAPDRAGLPADVAGAPGELLHEFQAALHEATAAVHDVLGAATSSARSLRAPAPQPAAPPSRPSAGAAVPVAPSTEPGRASAAPAGPAARETELHLSVADQPWWADHAFYEQPVGWPCLEDEFPLVPMTAILEMLATEAEALVPGSVTVAIESVRAFRWLAVEPPVTVVAKAAVDEAATAARTDGATVVKTSIEGHARATVVVARAYTAAPEPTARPVTGSIPIPIDVEHLYEERHLFHGPEYQGLRAFDVFGVDGVDGRLTTKPAPGRCSTTPASCSGSGSPSGWTGTGSSCRRRSTGSRSGGPTRRRGPRCAAWSTSPTSPTSP